MKVKILTPKEYEELKEDWALVIVSKLQMTLADNDFVAVDLGDGTYKVIKFVRTYLDDSLRHEEEKFPLIVTKEQLQNYIFLKAIDCKNF